MTVFVAGFYAAVAAIAGTGAYRNRGLLADLARLPFSLMADFRAIAAEEKALRDGGQS